MPVSKRRVKCAYGFDNAIQRLAPLPIVSQRAPTTDDLAQVGQTWIDQPNNAVYMLTSITANSANWATTPASGSETLSQLTVTGTTNLQGAVTLDSTLAVTGATTLADANITGTMTFTGDVDLTSSAVIDITSTLNADPAIRIVENGGVNGTIRIRADQGTRTDSVELLSDVGGISLIATGYALDDAISILANSGGVDIDAALQINIASSENAADAIVINASAGGIDITNTGTAGEDIDIISTGASVNVTSTEAAADAIVLTASDNAGGIDITSSGTAGDIDVTSAGGINITSTEAAIDAINIIASDNDGGIALTSSGTGGDICVTSAGSVDISSTEDAQSSIFLLADGGTSESIFLRSFQGTDPASILLQSDAGGITFTSNLATADGINLNAIGGGVDIDAADSIDLTSTKNGTNSIRLRANAGISEQIKIVAVQGTDVDSIDIDSLNGGITISGGLATADAINIEAPFGGIDIDSTTGLSIFNVSSGDISISNAGANVTISSILGNIQQTATTGNITHQATVGRITLTGGGALADAIVINASNAAGGIDITCGTGGMDLTATGGDINLTSTNNTADAIYLRANAGISETIRLHADQGTGVNSINLESDVGGITLTATGLASDDAINLNAVAGGVDIDGALQVNIASSEAAADAIVITASDNAGGIDITSGGTGGDIDITSAGGINISSTENAADAIVINASAGGIDITNTGTAGEDIDITSTGASVNVTSTEAAADAIVINSSNAAGGIDLLTGGGDIDINSSGNVSMAPATATAASPTATVVINARVFKATFTGFTTGAAASQAFTITNSALGAGDGVMLTVANRGSNDAQMTLNRVNTQTAGTIIVNTTNNGAAALNGDVIITGWIID